MKKRFLSMGLAVMFILSLCCGVVAAVESRASTTLSFVTVTASQGDNAGDVEITYDVRASQIADRIGVSSIKIYKADGTYVTTITGTTANGLVRTGTTRHKSSYIYQGSAGTSYYAVVTVFATIGSDSDSRTVTTGTV